MKVKGDLSQMLFQNGIKRILKALVIAFVMLVSPAFATEYNIYYNSMGADTEASSNPVQYYVDGSTVYYKTDVNASSWSSTNGSYVLNSPSKSGYGLDGWCVFNSQSAAAAANYDCQYPIEMLTANSDYDGGNNVVNVSNTGNLYLYAKWASPYTITYDSMGADTEASSNPVRYYVHDSMLYYKNDVNASSWDSTNGFYLLNSPSKSGYGLAGWCAFSSQSAAAAANYDCQNPKQYLAVGSSYTGSKYLNVSSNPGNYYLYAKWAPVYSITYDSMGADAEASNSPVQYYVDGSYLYYNRVYDVWDSTSYSASLGTPSKSGYVFAGWCAFESESDAATAGYDCQNPKTSLTANSSYSGSGYLNVSNGGNYYLYAKWTPVHSITYNSMGADNEASGKPVRYYVYGSTLYYKTDVNASSWDSSTTYKFLGQPLKSGYAFAGWCAFESESAAATANYDCQNPKTSLTANSSYSGSNYLNLSVSSNVRDWYLYAKWTLQTYTITYVLDGGTNHPSNPATYTTEDTITLRDPTKDGYAFVGWYGNSSFVDTSVAEITSGSYWDKTFYAKWVPVSYDIHYYDREGQNIVEISGSPVQYYVDNSKLYYKEDDARWFYTTDSANDFSKPTNKTDFAFEGWCVFSSTSEAAAANYTCENPKRFYTINSYYDDSNAGLNVSNTGDLYLYAKWLPAYTIHYDNNVSALNGATVTPASSNPAQYYINYSLFPGTRTLFYRTDINTNSWSGNNGNVTINLRSPSVSSGFIFGGWCVFENAQADVEYAVENNCQNPVNYLSTNSSASGYYRVSSDTGDLYLYARWLPIYNITYDSMNADTEASSNPVQYYADGSKLYYKTNANASYWNNTNSSQSLGTPTKTGYTFLGWCAFSSAQVDKEDAVANHCDNLIQNLSALNTGDLYLYAKWGQGHDIYNIYYYDDSIYPTFEISGTPEQYLVDGTRLYYKSSSWYNTNSSQSLSAPTKTGYAFVGWCAFNSASDAASANYACQNPVEYLTANSNYSGSEYLNVSSNPGNYYLYAKWTPIYSITYNSRGADTEASNSPVQYYVDGSTLYYKTDANASSWTYTSSARSLGAPTKNGYGFAGWCAFSSTSDAVSANYDCANPVLALTTGPTDIYYLGNSDYLNVLSNPGNYYLYAKWTPIYSITYDSRGADTEASDNPVIYYIAGSVLRYKVSSNNDWYYDQIYKGLDAPTKNGYGFVGWCAFSSTSEAASANYDCQNPVWALTTQTSEYYTGDAYLNVLNTGDLYLYAKWAPIYSITYNSMGADAEAANNPVLYYTGSSKVYYKTDANAGSWSPSWGATGYNRVSLHAPTKTGYVFTGWCAFSSTSDAATANYDCQEPNQDLLAGDGGTGSLNVSNTGNLYLYAKWVPIYSITYDSRGADTEASDNPVQYYVYDSRLYYKTDASASYWSSTGGSYTLNSPTKSGYIFSGWCAFSSTSDAATAGYDCQNPKTSLTANSSYSGSGYLNVSNGGNYYLYAKWKPISTIYYDNNVSVLGSGATVTSASNNPVQYYLYVPTQGTDIINFYYKTDANASSWNWGNLYGYAMSLNAPSTTAKFDFVGWCAFNSTSAAASANYDCQNPVKYLMANSNYYTGSQYLNVSNTGDLYLYAKWAPIYSITYNSMSSSITNLNTIDYYYIYNNNLYSKTKDYGWNYYSHDSIGLPYPSDSSDEHFLGWCVFESESDAISANYTCMQPKIDLTINSANDVYPWYYNVSNPSDLYLYAKWTPIYSISYDTTGATYVPDNPISYWYDGIEYHYNYNSWSVQGVSMNLSSPSGEQSFSGWYVCTSQQNDVYAAAANSNDCTFFADNGSGETSVSGIYGSDLYMYASFGPQTIQCSAGQYAYHNGVNLSCQPCPQNFYCDGMNLSGGSDLTEEDNGKYACGTQYSNRTYHSDRLYSNSDATSEAGCGVCPRFPGYSKNSGDEHYVPIKAEEPYNFFYSSNTDPVWKDFNGDGIGSASECIKPAYAINLETLKCSTPAAQLQAQFGDYYYALGLDQPCNPNNIEAGLMSCNYDVSTGNYTGCSSMVTVCDATDLQSLAGLFMGNTASTDAFLNMELERKGLSQSTVNWNTLFKQNNSYINDVSTLSSSANITKSSVGCDTHACEAGEYARIEYVNGVGTASCEPCTAGSFCPDSKTYSFANGDFVVDPTNSNVYTAGKFACPAGSTSAAESETCTCVSGSEYNPAGNSTVNVSVGNMSTTKTPEVITLTDEDDNEYYACANVYVSAINSTAFNSWVSGGMSSDDLLTQAGARVVMCKYNAEDSKYNLCSPAFTACNGTIAQLMLAPTGMIIDNLAQMFDPESSSLPDDIFEEVSTTLGVDSIQTINACPDPNMPQAIGGSCATGYYWENYYDEDRYVYTGNNCCPNGYACCLAGTAYDPSGKVERCEDCSGEASCPATYTERLVCLSGTYIDQSAIGTNAQCVECPVGHYCPGVSVAWDGQSTLTDAEAGKFACADGSYADETGLTSCKVCTNGMSTGGATGSTSDSACSVTTCVDDLQYNRYDPAGTTYVDRKSSAFVTFYDIKNESTYQKCTKAYVTVLDNTVFANGIANATADELSKAGMRLILCTYNNTTGKYTDCSYAVPACDATYRGMMLGYNTTDQIATAVATGYGAPYLPSVVMANADASGALGIDGIRNFYGTASGGTPTCAASCSVNPPYEWESYTNDKEETYYTGNTCCPKNHACCIAGWKYNEETGRCAECSGSDCPVTYTKSAVCPAGTYINQSAIGTDNQCVSCEAGSYCPGIVWDVTTTFDSGKYTCEPNTFSGANATECTPCPAGATTATSGSTSISACQCPSGSATNPAGNTIINVSVGGMSTVKTPEPITLTDDNDNEYQACANVYVSALNSTAFNSWVSGGMSSDDLLTQAGARVVMCKYNAEENKYNLCSPAFTACNDQIAQLMLAPTGTVISNLVQMFGGGSSLPDDSFEQVPNTLGIDALQTANACPDPQIQQYMPLIYGSCATGYYWENYYDKDKDRTVYTGNNCCPNGYACCLAGHSYDVTSDSCQPCSGASCPATYTEVVKPVVCPATGSHYTDPYPINLQGGSGVMEIDMRDMEMGVESSYGTTQNECVAIRLYYNTSTPFMSASSMADMTASDYVDAGASVAFCKYNPSTGYYDGDCTPKYSLCSTDNIMSLFASGNSVGVMKAVLGITSDGAVGNYFTVKNHNSLSSASTKNRCSGGIICPDAGDFSNMSLSGAGMMQMGNDMEGSYGETSADCLSMRVYYDDGSVLFNGYNPSMDINDWVDAGASIAFCKYNTGDSATDLCTPKYSLCSDDNMMTLMGAGNAAGIMQALLGVNNPSALGTYFTETPSSLASATATNRCGVDCTLVENSTGTDDGNGGCGCATGYEWNSSTGTCDGISVSINWAGVNEPGEAGTCTYGGTLSTPTAPELTGYAFAGWTVGHVVANNNVQEQDNGEEIGKGE